MFTIRTDDEIDEMIAYLRNHKVKFPVNLKEVIRAELRKLCTEFKMKRAKVNIPF